MRTRIHTSRLPHRLVQALERLTQLFQRPTPLPAGVTPAHITIDDTVVAAQPERFGVNLQVFDYEPWNSNALIFNNWTTDAGMEPIILRYKGTATGGSADSIDNDAGPTTTAADTI